MRRKRNYKRNYKPDIRHNSVTATRFINYLMHDGKKATAQKVFYSALDKVEADTKQKGMQMFEKALENAAPFVEVVSKRVGGANYQVPREVRPTRKFMLAARWMIEAARNKKGKPMAEKLAEEIVLAAKNEGSAIKKKQDVHRMAEANRAFANFNW
jgi:small subunit ribosomal protein S7